MTLNLFTLEEYSLFKYIPICIGLPILSWVHLSNMYVQSSLTDRVVMLRFKKCNFYPPPVQEKSSMKSYYPTSFEGSSRLLLDSRFLRKTVSSDIAKQEVEASCHQNGARYEPRWQPWPYLWPGRIRTFSLLKQLLVKGGSTTVSKITKVLDK